MTLHGCHSHIRAILFLYVCTSPSSKAEAGCVARTPFRHREEAIATAPSVPYVILAGDPFSEYDRRLEHHAADSGLRACAFQCGELKQMRIAGNGILSGRIPQVATCLGDSQSKTPRSPTVRASDVGVDPDEIPLDAMPLTQSQPRRRATPRRVRSLLELGDVFL